MEKEPLLTQVWEICTTVASEEDATTIANSLLELRLAACCQIAGPIRSLYRWKDAIHDDSEWKLTVKTTEKHFDACWNEMRRIHPYEVPELVAHPAAKVSMEYAHWLCEQVGPLTIHTHPQRWHLRIAGLPLNATLGGQETILGRSLETLLLPTGPSPMSVSFEWVAEKLLRMPNLHFEPDGAFTWGSTERHSKAKRKWQLDGMIYDRENLIEYVELKGNCDRTTWESLTEVLSGVECTPLVVQWITQGIWISESNFKRCIE